MNNAARGTVFAVFLLGTFVMSIITIGYVESDSEDSAKGAVACGLLAVAAALIAAGALSGITPPTPKAARFVPPTVPPQAPPQPQAQPYAQPGNPGYASYGQPQPGAQQPGAQQPGGQRPQQQQ